MPKKTVTLRDGSKKELLFADNQFIYRLGCPIDGTPLIATPSGIDSATSYRCKTCDAHYGSRKGRISEEELERQARSYAEDVRRELESLESKKSKLVEILDIVERNNFV